MNRYPLWKYLLIAFVLGIGFLYASPNIFGEVPAVQVSPVQAGTPLDTSLVTRVEEALAKEGVQSQGALLEATKQTVAESGQQVLQRLAQSRRDAPAPAAPGR